MGKYLEEKKVHLVLLFWFSCVLLNLLALYFWRNTPLFQVVNNRRFLLPWGFLGLWFHPCLRGSYCWRQRKQNRVKWINFAAEIIIITEWLWNLELMKDRWQESALFPIKVTLNSHDSISDIFSHLSNILTTLYQVVSLVSIFSSHKGRMQTSDL